ncbi:TetR/AcrR family transcriptional regulator [Bacillus sp. M6-12]|uniref:TetR/AcrR family transcriptional regulator n=1 Tax=Bacillus sp. M6-12 TaxID=2054166 RepID=UPI000C78DA6A|nr:TetR/AcrR family transcriptional regulator [Bacillus sp. M6-12]PLS17265.1 TetR/AcrR family transcriptional regulator [Bacillus sp. M6-12]
MPPVVSEAYREKKKEEILNSALVCFANKGFENSTIDDIVAHSGISKGSIYIYFKSKEDIYVEMISRQTKQSFEKITSEVAQLKSSFEKVNYLFQLYLAPNFPAGDEEVRKMLVSFEFKLYSSRHKHINDLLTKRRHEYFISLVAGILKDGQQSGEVSSHIKPEIYADLFWTMIDGLLMQSVYKDYPQQEILLQMQRMFNEGVKNGENSTIASSSEQSASSPDIAKVPHVAVSASIYQDLNIIGSGPNKIPPLLF